MPINYENFMRAADVIESGKYDIDMKWWHKIAGGWRSFSDFKSVSDYTSLHSCRTTHCIAGSVQCEFATTDRQKRRSAEVFSSDFLGLTICRKDALFYTTYWPSKFRKRYNNAKTNKTRSRICAEVIRHYADEWMKEEGK